MKAVVVEHLGEAGSLKEVPTPQPGEREILVRVTAAGVNPIDWKSRDRGERPLPFVLGQDFAGVVSTVGSHVSKYREGERVFGTVRKHGTFAEYTVAPEESHDEPISKISDVVGDADAAALPTPGLTALAAIEWLRVGKGTTLLVTGATGGVGGFAVQMARDRGAHVIGTAGSGSESVARELGIDEFIAYDKQDVVAAIRAAHSGGIDAVLDLVDDSEKIKAIGELVRDGGRLVSTIGAADVDRLATRDVAALNIVVTLTPESSHAGLRTLLEMVEQQRVRVLITAERPLAEAVGALEESKRSNAGGKIVITVA